ncbi:MAG: sulfatase [Opitutales bacterium]
MRFLSACLASFGIYVSAAVLGFAAETPPPNFVVIFADDLGYGDLGCYGHPSIRTPYLDRMAAEGVRFTDFYVAANVCTPSRAALLTGRLPIRNGMAGQMNKRVLYANSTGGLPREEITMAEALKDEGYATALIGKWHLGSPPEHSPLHHGFETFFGLPYSNDMELVPELAPSRAAYRMDPKSEWWDVPLWLNEEIVERPVNQENLTRRYTEEAVAFIERSREKPFFLYMAHTFPHVPLFASEGFHDQSPRGRYGDTIEEIDWSTGQILETLRRSGLAENTLVVFTSDNGPWLVRDLAGGSAGLLRDGKGSTYEGGMRVPAIAWWPEKIAGGVVSREIVSCMDLFPTFLQLAGAEIPRDRVIDGVDLSPVLFGNGPSLRDTILYYRSDELYAIRKGNFKAHFTTWTGYSREEAERHDPPLLFQVGHDPSERFNLAENHPEILAEIDAVRQAHLGELVPGEAQLTDGDFRGRWVR